MVKYVKLTNRGKVFQCTNKEWEDLKRLGGFIKVGESKSNKKAIEIIEAEKKAAKEE